MSMIFSICTANVQLITLALFVLNAKKFLNSKLIHSVNFMLQRCHCHVFLDIDKWLLKQKETILTKMHFVIITL